MKVSWKLIALASIVANGSFAVVMEAQSKGLMHHEVSTKDAKELAILWSENYAGLLDRFCGPSISSECLDRPTVPKQSLDFETAKRERNRVDLFVHGEEPKLQGTIKMSK